MVTVLIGLPLFTAYYFVNPTFVYQALVPYLAISAIFALYIIRRASLKNVSGNDNPLLPGKSSYLIAKFNSFSSYLAMALFTLMVTLFAGMRFLISSYYPYPPPPTADYLGTGYILLLIAVSVIGFSKIIYSFFPLIQKILVIRKYALMSLVMSLSFALVYLLVVNQILIEGLNTVANVSPPGNYYPYAHVFTAGIDQPFLNLVYIPYAVVQFSPRVNLLIVPFEIVFTALLSLLVGTNVVMAHYLISNSGLRCSTKGTVLSTGGSILGLTATCPTCLAPTLISVVFGGVVAAEQAYSNLYGVILPPVLSIATLVVSILYLSRMIKGMTSLASSPLQSMNKSSKEL